VRGAVIRDGKILLVQEITDGCWSLPGGWADLGESPREMVEREVLEESGMQVKARKVVAVYDACNFQPLEFWHAYKIVFLCDILGGEPTPSMETPAVRFFAPANLPRSLLFAPTSASSTRFSPTWPTLTAQQVSINAF
jgi:ADP-ribose pyrophosphatase YjhB (NUDIX family)